MMEDNNFSTIIQSANRCQTVHWAIMNRTHHLLRSALVVIFLLGLNKVTGFVKLLLMTARYGAGPEADAFTAANQLPELFETMLAGGALGAALIPIYSRYLLRGERAEATTLANTVLTLTVVLMGSVGGLAAALALPLATYLLVPQFPPAQQALTAELMQISLIAMTIFSIGSLFTSLLNARQHFFTPALATVGIDLGQILGLYLLAPHWGIYGVAWGSVIGALLAAGVQLLPFVRQGIVSRPQLAWRLPGLHELVRLMGPRVITLGAVQAADLVLIRLASPLPAGSIAAYYYAMLIMVAMPRSLFATAITTVVFPTLAEQYNAGQETALRRTVGRSLQAAWALIIPGAVGLLALGPPAVAFLLQRGAFDAEATMLVYLLLVIFALRLVAETTQDILLMPFYARHDTRTPMWVSLGWLVAYVGLSYGLVGLLGIYGLALAATLAVSGAALALYLLNRRVDQRLEGAQLGWSLGRIGLACVGMSLVVVAIRALGLGLLPYLVSAIGVGGIVYLALFYLLGGRQLVAGLVPAWPARFALWPRKGL
jgi:putative peptidoglycan lipid II flippase